MNQPPSSSQIEAWTSRSPARRMSEVPIEIREALDSGWIESKNLVEWLGINRIQLAKQLARELDLDKTVEEQLSAMSDKKALKQSFAIGTLFAESISLGDSSFKSLTTHCSDVVREWSAVLIGAKIDVPLKKKLAWVKPLADDENSGVREVAWISLRGSIIAELETAIACLVPWTGSRRENLRRYASEITRPRGVWAAHISQLKITPELGLPILEPLRADPSQYVRNSVANWLNDASKTHGPWVESIAGRWKKESPCGETESILKRALRTLRKTKANLARE